MNEIFSWLQEQLGDNEFFKGGFLLLLIGSLGYWGRRIPAMIWTGIKRLLLVTVSFDDRTTLYQLFQSWVSDQGLMAGKRDVVLKVDDRADPPKILVVPDRRAYLVRIAGVLCKLSKKRDEDAPGQQAGEQSDGFSSMMRPERIWLTCFFWDRKKVLDTLHYIIREYGIEKEDSTPIYDISWGWWKEQCKLPLRSPDNLILRGAQLEVILQDGREFLESRSWYEERQIPWQRGYLFCGPPGTGKTTLAATLASEFKMRLCLLDLGAMDKDREIRDAFNSLPSRAIVLIEDFDSFFQGRKTLADSRMTFSGLLNSINGVVSSPGRILIITTNVTQDVDPALLRAGRIDRVFKLEHVDDDQARRILKKFIPYVGDEIAFNFCNGVVEHNLSPADLVGHLQKYRRDDAMALNRQCMIEERDLRLEVDSELKAEEERLEEERKRKAKEKEEADEDSPKNKSAIPQPPTVR